MSDEKQKFARAADVLLAALKLVDLDICWDKGEPPWAHDLHGGGPTWAYEINVLEKRQALKARDFWKAHP